MQTFQEGGIHITEQELRKPTCDTINQIFVPFTEEFQFTDTEQLIEENMHIIQISTYNNHQKSLQIITLYQQVKQMMNICCYPGFEIADIISPKVHRLRDQLSALFNFLKFKSMFENNCFNYLEGISSVREEKDQLQAEIVEKQDQIQQNKRFEADIIEYKQTVDKKIQQMEQNDCLRRIQDIKTDIINLQTQDQNQQNNIKNIEESIARTRQMLDQQSGKVYSKEDYEQYISQNALLEKEIMEQKETITKLQSILSQKQVEMSVDQGKKDELIKLLEIVEDVFNLKRLVQETRESIEETEIINQSKRVEINSIKNQIQQKIDQYKDYQKQLEQKQPVSQAENSYKELQNRLKNAKNDEYNLVSDQETVIEQEQGIKEQLASMKEQNMIMCRKLVEKITQLMELYVAETNNFKDL